MRDSVSIEPRRVVVTGLGVACALGFDLDLFWRNILAGRSGLGRLPFVPEDSPLSCQIGGYIPNAALQAALDAHHIADPDRVNQLALVVAAAALKFGGLRPTAETPSEYAVILGTGHGNSLFHNESIASFLRGGYRKFRPSSVVRAMFNRPANSVSIHHHLTGVSFSLSAACASGSIAMGMAYQQVRCGSAEGALVIACDAGLDLPTFSAWNRLGVLSRNPDPEKACRPFDRDRDGLVMGEGAAGFLLETLETARDRGAPILAEVIGVGLSSDAKHVVQPDRLGQIKAIRKALEAAGITPEELDYVNAHGTATPLADTVESASLLEALGDHGKRVPVSNTKAQLGHLMGATAGVELVTTILALRHQLVPPCRNLENPDPECPLNFVRDRPLSRPIRVAMKNSFAFGGTNSVVVLRRWEA